MACSRYAFISHRLDTGSFLCSTPRPHGKIGRRLGRTNPLKNCDTCRHSFDQIEETSGGAAVRRQHCDSPDYNAPSYTEEMMLEDWDRGYCRFWEPRT